MLVPRPPGFRGPRPTRPPASFSPTDQGGGWAGRFQGRRLDAARAFCPRTPGPGTGRRAGRRQSCVTPPRGLSGKNATTGSRNAGAEWWRRPAEASERHGEVDAWGPVRCRPPVPATLFTDRRDTTRTAVPRQRKTRYRRFQVATPGAEIEGPSCVKERVWGKTAETEMVATTTLSIPFPKSHVLACWSSRLCSRFLGLHAVPGALCPASRRARRRPVPAHRDGQATATPHDRTPSSRFSGRRCARARCRASIVRRQGQ